MFLSCMHRLSMHRLIQSLTQFIDSILIPFYPVRWSPPYRGFLGSLCLFKNRKWGNFCFNQSICMLCFHSKSCASKHRFLFLKGYFWHKALITPMYFETRIQQISIQFKTEVKSSHTIGHFLTEHFAVGKGERNNGWKGHKESSLELQRFHVI